MLKSEVSTRRPFSNTTVVIGLLILITSFFQWETHLENTLLKSSTQPQRKIDEWIQPESITHYFPNPSRNNAWLFNYKYIEQSLNEIELTPSSELIIDSFTAEILTNAGNKIDRKISKRDLNRMFFLVEKGMPEKAGTKLARLLEAFYHFSLQHDANPTITLSQEIELQQLHFGNKLSRNLFSKKNAVRAYLEEKRTIQNNNDLDYARKKSALHALNNRFKKKNVDLK